MGAPNNQIDEISRDQCREAVHQLSKQWDLELFPRDRERWIERTAYYVNRHMAYLREKGRSIPKNLLIKIAENYYRDGAVVESLADPHASEHDAHWAEWIQRIQQWTCRVGFRKIVPGRYGPHEDLAFAGGDLDLDCVDALRKALPSFNFASRFTTWAYSIFLRQAGSWRSRSKSREPSPGEGLSLNAPLGSQEDEGWTWQHRIATNRPPPEEHARQQLLLQAIERAAHELVQAGGKWPAAVYAWREHARGVPQVEIARKLNRSKATISRYVRAVRDALGQSPEVKRYM